MPPRDVLLDWFARPWPAGGRAARWLAQTTVADVRDLIAGTILTVYHGPRHGLCWFAWRLTRKIRAQLSYYHRRGDPLPARLRRWTQLRQAQPSPTHDPQL